MPVSADLNFAPVHFPLSVPLERVFSSLLSYLSWGRLNQSECPNCAYISSLQGVLEGKTSSHSPTTSDFLENGSRSLHVSIFTMGIPHSRKEGLPFEAETSEEEALKNTRQVKRWNLELLEEGKHLSRMNPRFIKAQSNLPFRKISGAADSVGNVRALLRV